MSVRLFAAILLAGHFTFSNTQDTSPPAVPQSLDNYGADVSDFSIMYTPNLQEIMQKFNIPRAEMEQLLRTYVSGGQPIIKRTVFNPDTGLNETITLDFKSFEEEAAAGVQPGMIPSGRRQVVPEVTAQIGGGPDGLTPTSGSSGLPPLGSDANGLPPVGGTGNSPREPIGLPPPGIAGLSPTGSTGLPSPGVIGVAPSDDWRRPPSPVENPASTSLSTDLTAMREYEERLIEDLKLLQRRREALDESFAQKVISKESYQQNVENNDLQMRDAYTVLQQVQNGIREFLGLPTQSPPAANDLPGIGMEPSSSTRIEDPQFDNFNPGMSNQVLAATNANLLPGDRKPTVFRPSENLMPNNINAFDGPLRDQQKPVQGHILSPEEELQQIQTELDRLRRERQQVEQSLSNLRMPTDGVPMPDRTTSPSDINRFVERTRDGSLGSMMAPGGRRPFPIPAVSGFDDGASSLLPPGVQGVGISSNDILPSSEAAVQRQINDLLNEFNMLNQRESDIMRIIDYSNARQQQAADPAFPVQPNMPQARVENTRERTFEGGNILNTDTTRTDPVLTLPDNLRINPVDDINRMRSEPMNTPIPSKDRRLINNLLNEYNELNQRESQIEQILNNGIQQNSIARNNLLNPTPPKATREFVRSADRNTKGFQTDDNLSPDNTIGMADQPLPALPNQNQPLTPGATLFGNMLDRPLGPGPINQQLRIRPDQRVVDGMGNQPMSQHDAALSNFLEQSLEQNSNGIIDQPFSGGSTQGDQFQANGGASYRFMDTVPYDGRMAAIANDGPGIPLEAFGMDQATGTDDSSFLSNDGMLDRPGMLPGASNIPPSVNNNQNSQASSPLGSPTDVSSTQGSGSNDRNLIYNDGTITMESVRPEGTFPGDRPFPIGQPEPIISGFSSSASGLLAPRRDSLSLQNRIYPRFEGRRFRKRIYNPRPRDGRRLLQRNIGGNVRRQTVF